MELDSTLSRGSTALRVQKLSESELSLVPPQYIQPPHHRPTTTATTTAATTTAATTATNIPVINLFNFNPDHATTVRSAIAQASTEWGAFQITNHGIPTSLLNEIKTLALSFFTDFSVSDKLSYACTPNSFASEGYGSQMLAFQKDDSNPNSNSSVLDWRDYFDHHTLPISRRDPSKWPPHYRDVMINYSDCMRILAKKLLALISESIGLSSSWIEDVITRMGEEQDVYQNVTVSYYPSCPQPDLTLGLQPHSDIGVITLIIQDDVGGLQVLDPHGDRWVTVRPVSADAIVVILADQTEILTNGKYKSAEHRVVTNSSRARMSISAFHDPPKTVKISPAAELISESSPIRYREVIYGDYTSSWYSNGPEGRRNLDAIKLHN